MSLVDQFDTRDFVNGRLIGGKYNEMTGNMAYSDISPYGGNRMAGSGVGLGPDVVTYMGEAAQGSRPQDAAMDEAIAEGFLGALSGDLAQSFDVTPGGDTRKSRKGLTAGDVQRLMEAYPNDAEKIQKMYLPGAQLPKRV